MESGPHKDRSVFEALLRKASLSFFVKVIGTALGALSSIVLARYLGVSEYGVFSFALSLITLFALPAKFGLDTAALRYISEYKVSKPEYLPLFIRSGFKIIATSSTAIVFGVIGLSYIFPELSTVQLAIALLPVLCVVHFLQSVLLGAGEVAKGQIPEPIVRPLIMLLFLGLMYLFQQELVAQDALGLYCLAYIVALIVAGYWVQRFLDSLALGNERRVADRSLIKGWLVTSAPMFLISCCHLLLSQTDIIILGLFQPSTEVGLYSAATRVGVFGMFFLFVAQSFLGPEIAAYHAKGDKQGMQRFVRLMANSIFGVTLVFLMVLFLFRSEILMLFGEDFLPASELLTIVLLVQLFKVIAAPSSYLVTMTGHERVGLRVIGFGGALNLILDLILIPRFGAMGAAYATLIATASWNTVMAVVIKRKLDIKAFVH